MTPRPLVALTTSISKPISPRVVIVASIMVECESFSMLVMMPLRLARFCTIEPTHSSGTSIQTVSKGSRRWPFVDLLDHGRPGDEQFEALAAHRLDEHRDLHRPAGLHVVDAGLVPVSSTLMETLVLSSR